MQDLPNDIALLKAEIRRLRDVNRGLNRRATGNDSHWQSRAMRAEETLRHYRVLYHETFDRYVGACDELRELHRMLAIYRDGEEPHYYSIGDSRLVPGSQGEMTRTREIYVTYLDGKRSERVVSAYEEHFAGLRTPSLLQRIQNLLPSPPENAITSLPDTEEEIAKISDEEVLEALFSESVVSQHTEEDNYDLSVNSPESYS